MAKSSHLYKTIFSVFMQEGCYVRNNYTWLYEISDEENRQKTLHQYAEKLEEQLQARFATVARIVPNLIKDEVFASEIVLEMIKDSQISIIDLMVKLVPIEQQLRVAAASR